MKHFLYLFCTAFLLHSVSLADKPNVVFILADDLGYGDIKAFGGKKSKVATPHFDRLCKEGMKFTNAHVTDSVCVPSRTSIMTGRYAFRFDKGERGGPWGFIGLRFPTTQHTVGKMFRTGGYSTGYVGKWHLGTRMTTKDGKEYQARDFIQVAEHAGLVAELDRTVVDIAIELLMDRQREEAPPMRLFVKLSEQTVAEQSREAERASSDKLLAKESTLNLKLSDYLLRATDRLNRLTEQNLQTRQQLDNLAQAE